MVLVRREHRTEIGPVDLLCRDSEGRAVAVEIKRQGGIDGVEQLARYLEFLERDPSLRPVRGVFVAQVIKPQAKALAAERGIRSEEHTSELQSLMRISYAVFCLKKKNITTHET